MGDSPIGFTKADAAWRTREAKWLEPWKPCIFSWVWSKKVFQTQLIDIFDIHGREKEKTQVLIFSAKNVCALAAIGNKAFSAVFPTWHNTSGVVPHNPGIICHIHLVGFNPFESNLNTCFQNQPSFTSIMLHLLNSTSR